MIIEELTPSGTQYRTLSLSELKTYARIGNREALKELIEIQGGFATITANQKDKIIKILLGYQEDL
jgi:hypothetical protein